VRGDWDFQNVTFTKDGGLFCLGGDYATASVRDAGTGTLQMPIPEHVTQASFSDDNSLLATVGAQATIHLWDLHQHRLRFALKGHGENLHHVAFSSDGRLLASVSWLGKVKVWSTAWGRERFDCLDFIKDLAQTRDGRRLAFNNVDSGWLTIWDAETGARLARLKRVNRRPFGCDFSPDGRRIAVGAINGETAIWEVETGRLLQVLRGHDHMVSAKCVRFSPDGRRLATASNDETAKIWDAESGKLIHTLRGHTNALNAIAFSPDGKLVATGSSDKTVRTWDVETGECRWVLRGHHQMVYPVIFSPDGRTLITSGRDRTMRFWDVESGSLVKVWALRGAAWAMGLSPDGRRMVLRTAQADAGLADVPTTEIWDVETSQPLLVIHGHGEMAETAGFSPDGRRVLADWWDSDMRQYETFPWREVEYPGPVSQKLTTRMRFYADRYWRERLEAERRGNQAGDGLTVCLPFDRSVIQPRDPTAPRQLVDLTDHYTSPIHELGFLDYNGMEARDLREMPRGRVTFNGIGFDVRGIIQLKFLEVGGPIFAAAWQDIPEAVRAIAVRQRFQRLHVLLSTHRVAPEGTAIGAIVLNYADGSRHECEILYGRHVRDYYQISDPRTTTDLARVAWEGDEPFVHQADFPTRLRVYQTAWDNPRPDEEVVSIDLVSKMTCSAPFIIAITVE
jgi:WD40 repeat protein